ncbi:MAG: class I SAM-dependent methyltransferase [candidate division WOR-3 bacterium]
MSPDPFDSRPEEYDAWYDENPQLFREELDLIKDWIGGSPSAPAPASSLEIGAGTGRFTSSLGIGFGIDRARRALRLARERGVRAVVGDAGALPFKGECFALVGIFFTLEFLAEPRKALEECHRILAPAGRLLVLHFLPSSPVTKKKGQGFYAGVVQLYGPRDICGMARGFRLVHERERGDISALLFAKT